MGGGIATSVIILGFIFVPKSKIFILENSATFPF